MAETVVWSITLDRRSVRVGERFFARIRVEIAKGYHLYSVTQPAGGPLPTCISAAPGFNVTWVANWPEPTRIFDQKFGMETEYHIGSLLFDVCVQAEATLPEGSQEAIFKVEYQLCDEQTCLRPETQELRATIFVEAATLAATCAAQGAASASGQAAGMPLTSQQRLQQLHKEGKNGVEFEEGVLQILKDDPSFPLGYIVLANRSEARGEFRLQRARLREGLAANPDSAELHYQLAVCLGTANRRLLLKDFARRFRKSPYAEIALRQLAKLSTGRAEARKILERAIKLRAGEASAILTERELYPLVAERDPARVIRLLKAASRLATNPDDFNMREMASSLTIFYTAVWKIQRLLKKGKNEKAARVAQSLQEPDIPYSGATEAEKVLLALLKARALAAGDQVERAYESLIAHPLILVRQELLDAAIRTGARLSKSPKRVEEYAWQKTLQQTYPSAEFEVPTKRSGNIRARQYRGRVLLVNVWNPG